VRSSAAALLDDVLSSLSFCEQQSTSMNALSLLAGFRFIDSFFPSGGFAFSSGLEAALQGGAVRTSDQFRTFVLDQLRQGLGSREAVAVGRAHGAAAADNLTLVTGVDRELEAMKLGADMRKASRQMGRQVLRIAAEHFDRPLLREFLAGAESGAAPGHLAVAFGVVLQAAGWEKEEAIAGFLYHSAAGYAAAALRLLPIGQRECQRMLHDWTPLISDLSRRAASRCEMSAWTPLHDIYAMRHSRLESRLFRS
jgi:urease accessory protein